jgi:SAM-dependent methyltransferase
MSSPDYADAYADPGVYDILHSPHTAGEIDLFQSCARDWSAPRGPWLEPACGSGRYLRVLAERGIRSTGFDLDQRMLDYARGVLRRKNQLARVRLHQADMADFIGTIGSARYAIALNPVNTLRHLHRPRQVTEHLRQIAVALKPGGLYLVGISFSRYGEEEPTEDVWTARRGSCSVRQIVQYLPPERRKRMERVFSHLQVDRPRGRSYLDSSYHLRSYDLDQWKGVIRRSPLHRVGAIDDLGNPVTDDIETSYQIEVLRKD